MDRLRGPQRRAGGSIDRANSGLFARDGLGKEGKKRSVRAK